MPSLADSKKLVAESLTTDVEHDAILASLRDEIDRHNRDKTRSSRRSTRHRAEADEHDRTASALRFRFKHEKHRSLKDHDRRRHRKHKHEQKDEPIAAEDDASHPFPREPLSPTAEPSDDAFLSSLLDALADDEAASYWESVYSQPIHTYERPSVQTESGELEHMSDEQYAAWVKRRMWEKTHPEVAAARDEANRRQREEDESKQRRREDFIRKRQREAWTQSSRARSGDEHEYVFDFAATNTATRIEDLAEWKQAWISYLEAWERLKSLDISTHEGEVSRLLPWPVLSPKPPTKPNIEEFLHHMPRGDAETRRRLLKAERVRWHPDKIQQRFAGRVDEGTMKVVTGIFQVIDALYTAEAAP